jgi:MFS transporter, DHA1 family, tetracycline resistance protein
MNRKASLTAIFLTIFIDLMGFGILIPILPTFASKNLGVSDFGIGAIIAVFSLMQFFFNPFLGKLSDRIGRRPIILVTQLLTVISYLMFSFSTTFSILFISRLLGGLGGSNIGVAQAYIADITTKEDRSKGMGIIGAAFGLGFVFGPIFGAFLSKYGYEVAGFGSAAFTFTAFMFAYFMLPESITKKSEAKIEYKIFDLQYVKTIAKMPTVSFLILLFFIIIFSISNIYGTFPLLGYKLYHFSDQQNGLLFGIMGIIGAVIQGGVMRRISQLFDERKLVLWGSFIMMFGIGLIPYGQNFLGVAVIISVLSVGSAMLQPTVLSMVSKYSPEEEQGTILGLNQSFSALGRVFGPLWGGLSYDMIGYQFPFITGAFFTLIAFVLSFFFLKKSKPEEINNV